MAGAAEVAHHHAETVVEGYGNTDPVGRGDALAFGGEIAIVQDVAVGQGGALGEPGGAGGVLDIDGVVGLQRGGDRIRFGPVDRVIACREGVPLRCVEKHRPLEVGTPIAHLCDHRHIVGGLEGWSRDDPSTFRLVEGIGQLMGAVGRVDIDQDHPDLGGRKLHQGPLGTVGGPQAYPIALA